MRECTKTAILLTVADILKIIMVIESIIIAVLIMYYFRLSLTQPQWLIGATPYIVITIVICAIGAWIYNMYTYYRRRCELKKRLGM
jgi:hypothetical protein